VGWDKICRPKSLGGLGLRDPGKLNRVMGEKIWWRWLKHPTELWARIWKIKYVPTTREELLIRFNDRIQGSNIWNTTWNNRMLIQKHTFWEIRNGEHSLFWQDSWQQQPPLTSIEDLNPLYQQMQSRDSLHVKDLWKENALHQPWRRWKTEPHELHLQAEMDLQTWRDCVNQRKIHIREGPNILRWGHSPTGNFSVKEAYHLQENYQGKPKEHIWSKIWNPKFWPKVSIFLWLISQNRILTWDNLRK
jgi:hypothetical protein